MALAWLQIQQLLFSGAPKLKGEAQMPMERVFKVCPATCHAPISVTGLVLPALAVLAYSS